MGDVNEAERTTEGPVRAPEPSRVRVVAIGASAGGLRALKGFFEALAPTRGVAFVVVQHLDPSHATLLSSLLRSSTAMTVTDIVDD